LPRTSVTLTESALNHVDSKAREKGQTRSDYIAEAIESVISGMSPELNQAKAELNQQKDELNQLRQNIANLENQITEKGRLLESQSTELNQLREELNQFRISSAKTESALKTREEEVSFLRGHVAQLTQLSLKPSEEEIKAKHWWKFWK
jgi:archaellum component FlaC